ncbi:MAG: SMP-30/gluconolactonase/LRE family protein [Algicola sp.]|nr:SMP-30/gluconolactonase/LRE family protein [Algicola sp.]
MVDCTLIKSTLIKTLNVNNQLGEGISWHPAQQAAWWTDIHSRQLFRYDLTADKTEQWDMPDRVGSFGFVKNSDDLIVAFESGIAFYNVNTCKIQWLGKPEAGRPGNRLNDGKVDPFGRFWVGGMVEKPTQAQQVAGLYKVDGSKITQALDGFGISNGLCWNVDGSLMYHADSNTRKIYQYDVDQQNGQVSNKQLFAETDAHCVPDGATVDAQGGVWSAQWGGKKVVRYTPDGKESFELEVPFSQPTCVCFGGPKLDLLFVTSARVGDEANEQAGNVLVYQTNVTGLNTSFFELSE